MLRGVYILIALIIILVLIPSSIPLYVQGVNVGRIFDYKPYSVFLILSPKKMDKNILEDVNDIIRSDRELIVSGVYYSIYTSRGTNVSIDDFNVNKSRILFLLFYIENLPYRSLIYLDDLRDNPGVNGTRILGKTDLVINGEVSIPAEKAMLTMEYLSPVIRSLIDRILKTMCNEYVDSNVHSTVEVNLYNLMDDLLYFSAMKGYRIIVFITVNNRSAYYTIHDALTSQNMKYVESRIYYFIRLKPGIRYHDTPPYMYLKNKIDGIVHRVREKYGSSISLSLEYASLYELAGYYDQLREYTCFTLLLMIPLFAFLGNAVLWSGISYFSDEISSLDSRGEKILKKNIGILFIVLFVVVEASITTLLYFLSPHIDNVSSSLMILLNAVALWLIYRSFKKRLEHVGVPEETIQVYSELDIKLGEGEDKGIKEIIHDPDEPTWIPVILLAVLTVFVAFIYSEVQDIAYYILLVLLVYSILTISGISYLGTSVIRRYLLDKVSVDRVSLLRILSRNTRILASLLFLLLFSITLTFTIYNDSVELFDSRCCNGRYVYVGEIGYGNNVADIVEELEKNFSDLDYLIVSFTVISFSPDEKSHKYPAWIVYREKGDGILREILTDKAYHKLFYDEKPVILVFGDKIEEHVDSRNLYVDGKPVYSGEVYVSKPAKTYCVKCFTAPYRDGCIRESYRVLYFSSYSIPPEKFLHMYIYKPANMFIFLPPNINVSSQSSILVYSSSKPRYVSNRVFLIDTSRINVVDYVIAYTATMNYISITIAITSAFLITTAITSLSLRRVKVDAREKLVKLLLLYALIAILGVVSGIGLAGFLEENGIYKYIVELW